jgi:hypothetical protein
MELDHVSRLVQVALDEFESVDLAISVRRAYRIARLRADAVSAHRLGLEMRPLGGAENDRGNAVKLLYPDLPYLEVKARHDELVGVFLSSRTPNRVDADTDSTAILGSIAELAAGHENATLALEISRKGSDWATMSKVTENLRWRREIWERIKSFVFEYLVQTETQLELSDTVAASIAEHRREVDLKLAEIAPQLRDQLQAALRTARLDGAEARSQVLLTCRRVLEAIADQLYPATDVPYESKDGAKRQVGQNQYRNRILASVESSESTTRAMRAAVADLATRLDRLDELTQKGVHADVSVAEMEFGLVQTYFLAGELLGTSRDSAMTL